MTKLAFVVPRYGPEVIGGAELGARLLAEHLVASRAADVEIFTTCALSARTWADELAAGTSVVNGVTVHRHRSEAGRDPQFDEWSGENLISPATMSRSLQHEWIRRQGPVCPAVVDAAVGSDADFVVYYPYLYYPTVEGVLADPGRAVLHPAAHDEPPIHMPIFGDVFTAARGLAFHTEEERRLVQRLFPVAGVRHTRIGLGIDPGVADHEEAARLVPEGAQIALCLGRVDRGKGTEVLARWFAALADAGRTHGLQLVFAGPVGDEPPAHPDVLTLGAVSEGVKWALLERAVVLISPSAYESFSLVLLEAWWAGAPVLVNARCAVTREHVVRSGGGFAFDSLSELAAAIERLATDPAARAVLSAAGRRYVEQQYTWEAVMGRYAHFLGHLA